MTGSGYGCLTRMEPAAIPGAHQTTSENVGSRAGVKTLRISAPADPLPLLGLQERAADVPITAASTVAVHSKQWNPPMRTFPFHRLGDGPVERTR